MFATDQATASSTIPTPAAAGTTGYFTNGNPSTGVAATIVDADWLNMIQQELLNVVTGAGLTPSKTTYNQVNQAIQTLYKPGRLLRVSVYRIVSGVQQVSVNGGAFTSTGATTFSAFAATSGALVKVQGAGGGSGGSQAASSGQWSFTGGGGSGAYGESWLMSGLTGVTVTVGAGGAAGAAGGAGGAGGTSSFGASISAPGGGASIAGTVSSASVGLFGGAAGGAISTGGNLLNTTGAVGIYGIAFATSNIVSGSGGASRYGAGAGANANSTSAGVAASNPGAGASGAISTNGGAAQVGAAGGTGQIEVWEYA